MSIIIRLQNLPWAANSVDIRRYFSGLSIPEGGVHIVGGEKGDAFIAFSTDEDARQAMQKDCGKIKDMQIKLLLSSRTEMMRVIEQARQLNIVGLQPVADSDRRRGRERTPTPPRRRDKSPSRDRRRSPDRRKRDRSRSRSPSNRRSRDVDRRSDRFKREERRFDETPRYRDDRRSRDTNTSQDKKYPPYAESDASDRQLPRSPSNTFNREQHETDRRYPASGNVFYESPSAQSETYVSTANDPPLPSYSISGYPQTQPKAAAPPRLEKGEVMVQSNLRPPAIRSAAENADMVSYNQRNSPAPPPYESKTSYGIRKYEQKLLPSGHSDIMGSGNISSKGLPITGSTSSYDKQRRRTRFESELQQPFFDIDDEEMNKTSSPFNRSVSIQDIPFSRQDEWARESGPAAENGRWNEKRQSLLNPPSIQKTNRDFVQVVPMDIEEGTSAPTEMLDVDKRALYNARNDGSLLDEDRRAPHIVESRSSKKPAPLSRGAPLSLTVEVRNLPRDSREPDLFEFFRGIALPPANVRLPIMSNGQSSGKGFVRFLNPADFKEALSRHMHYIRGNRIEVVACAETAFEAAPKIIGNSSTPPIRAPKFYPREEDLCVHLRGLPFACKDDDIVRYFDGLAILDLRIELNPDGRAAGTAYVEFGNSEDFHAALEMNGKKMGHRFVNIVIASKNMMYGARGEEPKRKFPYPRETEPPARPVMKPQNRGPPPCVTLRGLPESVVNQDIVEFFGSFGIMPRAIHVMLRPDKKPAGDAFAELSGEDELEVSLTKNGDILLGNRISVTPITFREMSDILGRKPGPPPTVQTPLLRTPLNDEPKPRRPPPNAGNGDMSLDPPPQRTGRPFLDPFGHPPMRPPFARMRGPPGPRGSMRPPRPHFRSDGNRFPPRSAGPPPSSGLQDFGAPGCVVAINNLHFRAGLEEILDFFGEYAINKDSVIRKYNENGQTTGEARIAFQNPRDAQRSVRELNQRAIMGRPISLSVL